MIKRAALARALALDPDILFLDEPTAGLDPIGAAAFDQLILTLRDALGLSVFLITHDLDTLYTITDRVAVLSQKKVTVAGPWPRSSRPTILDPRILSRPARAGGGTGRRWRRAGALNNGNPSSSCFDRPSHRHGGGRRHAVRPMADQVERR